MKRSKQNGSITRHHGWWVLRYRELVGEGGVVKTLLKSRRLAPVDAQHKTKASVRRIADEVLEPLQGRKVSPLFVTTLGDFVERLYLPFAEQQKRPSTYRAYAQMWNAYLKDQCGPAWLREVETHDVQKWLEAIAKTPRKRNNLEYTLSKNTMAHIKHLLGGVFRYAARQGYFNQTNPVQLAEIPAFAPKEKEGGAYGLEEIDLMLRVLPEPAATIVATAAYTGLRLGELQGLSWEDYTPPLDENQVGTIEVKRSVWRGKVGEPKTEKSRAPVPVIPQLAFRLECFRGSRLVSPDHGPIFANSAGNPLDLNSLYYRSMRQELKKTGVKWLGWHGFRRGLASNLNRLGIDDSVIQAVLRHSDVSLTQRCYIKTSSPDAVAAMHKLSVRVAELCNPTALGLPAHPMDVQ
ncbi:MAG TPA: tyrosine-type recombinase/integrase [Pyrinomonadaceae bacterium]|nr:tyrosine-type recombinase/integrase [Pyrinomonadaceae bacterium]